MLILSRKPGEQLIVGENIVVTVTKVRGGRVQIGIDAPDDVRIRRGEYEKCDDGKDAT